MVELHNTWLVSVALLYCNCRQIADLEIKTDIVKTYIEWAVNQGFAVIDVNLPKHASDIDGQQKHEEVDSVENRTLEATQLLSYLWDNYIELNDSTHVFLMGTNIGHGAIINFIKANEERAQDQLTGAISFVQDVPLQSCRSVNNDALGVSLGSWYHSISLVFVTSEHNFWSSDVSRKPKKRFGKVNRSSEETITDMLIEHQDAVFELLSEDTQEWRSARPMSEDEATVDRPAASQLPPISNFSLSPAPKASKRPQSPLKATTADLLSSPRGRQAHPVPQGRPSRSPMR